MAGLLSPHKTYYYAPPLDATLYVQTDTESLPVHIEDVTYYLTVRTPDSELLILDENSHLAIVTDDKKLNHTYLPLPNFSGLQPWDPAATTILSVKRGFFM